jgi:hypothetical protein
MYKLQTQYSYINFGGCCVIASCLADQLHKVGVPVRIVVSESIWAGELPTINEARKRLKKENNTTRDWNLGGVYFGHVVAEVKVNKRWHILDTDCGCIPSAEYWADRPLKPFKGYLTLDEARFLAGRKDGWNPTFEREQIKGIKQMVSLYFSKLAQNNLPTAC